MWFIHFAQMENVSNFLKACRAVGVAEHSLFETVDLYEGKDLGLVVRCLVRSCCGRTDSMLTVERDVGHFFCCFCAPWLLARTYGLACEGYRCVDHVLGMIVTVVLMFLCRKRCYLECAGVRGTIVHTRTTIPRLQSIPFREVS